MVGNVSAQLDPLEILSKIIYSFFGPQISINFLVFLSVLIAVLLNLLLPKRLYSVDKRNLVNT